MNLYKIKARRKCIRPLLWLTVWVVSAFAGQAAADETPGDALYRLENWARASDSELDQLRGGFVLPNGMNIGFSLERIVSLNGTVVSSSFFQLPGNALLLQNGGLNQSPDLVGEGLSSVIQNNVDNQVISSVTDINIAVSNLKNLNLNTNGMIFNDLIQPNVH
ncbi:MAG: hypothetical protein ACU83U_09215 [Gammaproteobacteria bacterium]